MAYKADDGKEFTNRPMMTQHNSRMAASKAKPHAKDPSKDESSSHEQVSCPSCGAKFELHPADMPENDSTGAGADGF